MFKHISKLAVLQITILCFALTLLMIISLPRVTNAGDNPLSLSNKLKNLIDQKRTVVISFTEPIAGEQFWIIPENIGDDKTGLRSMNEIGSDYFCVREAGEGAIDVKCVPFTNIAQVSYEDM